MFPGWLGTLAYATPFPAIVQTPIDLVTGQATGAAGMLLAGRLVLARATHKLVVQGG
jgi:ABC-2 type transport system permease protein